MEDPEAPLRIHHHIFNEDELVQLSFLRDEETDALIAAGLLDSSLRLSSPLDRGVVFELPELRLRVSTSTLYPVQTPSWQVESKSLPREWTDTLRRRLREIVADTEAEGSSLVRWEGREDEETGFGIFESPMIVLQLAQEARRHADAYRSEKSSTATEWSSSPSTDKHYWFLGEGTKAAANIGQLDQLTLREKAYNLLQASPAQIAARVPGHCRVLHVEQVLRSDLAQDLQNFQCRLRYTLSSKSADSLRPFMPQELRGTRRVEDMIDHLVRPRVTFHGTQRQHVPSIVRHGFITPGKRNPNTGTEHKVRCGSTYGRGVYSSPDAAFALSYSQSYGEGYGTRPTSASEYHGIKLVVCATVMGRSRLMYRDDEWWAKEQVFEGFDSHVGNEGLEYTVFDRAQTIPVYVVHLDWGADNAEYFLNLPRDPRAWAATTSGRHTRAAETRLSASNMFPGDRQRAKEAVFARASKWFPYGFGPAAGTSFIVEEVGEVSEDEEEYGEYQALRGDEGEDDDDGRQSEMNFWAWVKVAATEQDGEEDIEHGRGLGQMLEGSHLADEYGDERKALRVAFGYRQKATDWDEIVVPGSEADLEKAVRAKQDDGFHLDRLMMEC